MSSGRSSAVFTGPIIAYHRVRLVLNHKVSQSSAASAGGLRAPGTNRVPPVDPVEHVGQLRGTDRNGSVRRRRPDEAATLQSLGVKRHADAVMPNDLDQVASGTSENVKIAGMRIAAEHLLHLQRQPVHAFPHVGSADRQPNPHPAGNRDHRRARTSSTRSNAAASTSRSTRTRRPLASSISISPAFLRRRRRGASLTAAGLSSRNGTGNGGTSLVISTATNDGSSEAPGTPITPSSANRRHLYTCAGDSPWRRATCDRFAPGAVASVRIASFCSTLNRRRRSTRPSNPAAGEDIDLALV